MMPRRYGEQSRVAFLPPEKICMAVALIFFALSFVTFFVADAVHRSGAYKWIDVEAMAEFWGNWLLACLGLCFFVHGTRFAVPKVHTGARRHSTDAALQVVR